ncbi:LysR family transcriptional regulator [Ottowia sp.]|uniref:LysR family transcriptional regulator n=1 Tax=Ottowia sp. TaxID=1898956 RepID=UPI002CFD9A3F|nr:LysR family transcriptional regulator [Ottowia sp.]HOB66775.1 LysR family transcriptional regulator [Ottowia sp.]HPZ58575.1 LysR family transcriptional regulator [Ottowia sp.]HQD48102.1 LysR family transcriptional regulator [Ottowia sp.]
MELRQLRYFEAVATTLNFTRAAEQLHIAQPPLSRQIQQLESELGVVLIDRSTRPLKLTRAGAFFYEQAVQILGRVHELKAATQRVGMGQRRWIGVGFVPSMLYGALPTVIHTYMAQHPDIDVRLSELTSLQQVDALLAGRIDIGFGRVAIDHDGLENTLVTEEPMVAVLPIGSPLVSQRVVTLKSLAQQTVVLYPAQPRPSFADQVIGHFRVRGLSIDRTFETNGLQTAIGLVAAGIGVSLVPSSVQRLQRDDVIYRSIDDAGLVSPMLMTTRAKDPSADLATFCDLVRHTITPPPGAKAPATSRAGTNRRR